MGNFISYIAFPFFAYTQIKPPCSWIIFLQANNPIPLLAYKLCDCFATIGLNCSFNMLSSTSVLSHTIRTRWYPPWGWTSTFNWVFCFVSGVLMHFQKARKNWVPTWLYLLSPKIRTLLQKHLYVQMYRSYPTHIGASRYHCIVAEDSAFVDQKDFCLSFLKKT